jgi:hypothetical protein
MPLNEKQAALCESNRTDFSGLSAVLLNCTLKRPEEDSHTGRLLSVRRRSCAATAWRWRSSGRRACRSPTASSPT